MGEKVCSLLTLKPLWKLFTNAWSQKLLTLHFYNQPDHIVPLAEMSDGELCNTLLTRTETQFNVTATLNYKFSKCYSGNTTLRGA